MQTMDTTTILDGCSINQKTRQDIFGSVSGGAGSSNPEKYQRSMIVAGTGFPCPKTNMRINLRTNELQQIAHPNKNANGFDYSEDFDGVQTVGTAAQIYINLKCIVGKGGVQTRSLREVYWFVEGQLAVLRKGNSDSVYFANILDGDEAHAQMNKFEYLLGLEENAAVKKNIYVGDLKQYLVWFREKFGADMAIKVDETPTP